MDRWLAWALLLLTPLVMVFGKVIARPLRSLGSEQWVTDRLDAMQDSLMSRVKRRTRFTVVTRVIMAACFSLGYLLAFVWGGLQLRAGAITFGVMTSFLQLVSQIQSPILTLLNMVPQLIHTTTSIDRLEELLQMEQVSETGEHPEPVAAGVAGVRIDNVSFRYPTGDRPIFDGFTYDFTPGSRTALMGPTGVGKTTLFRLMLSLVQPVEGTLHLYDGDREFPISPLTRSDFVFVPQGNTLMSGSVRFNLQLARPSATDDEMRRVLHTAAADFVFDLPSGLDTELGERGVGLSEGQAQRIAIARGLLRPAVAALCDNTLTL